MNPQTEQGLKGSRTKGKTLTNNIRESNTKIQETEQKSKLENSIERN